MFAVDASLAVAEYLAGTCFASFGRERLVAPPLMWSETRSVLHLSMSKQRVTQTNALTARSHLRSSKIELVDHELLGITAWEIADELGWARTYDAEYLAIARLHDCKLVTLDEKLLRGTRRLDLAVHPNDL